MSKIITVFLASIKLIGLGIFKFMRMYAVPCIKFINSFKLLLESKIEPKAFVAVEYFNKTMDISTVFMLLLLDAFVYSIKLLCKNIKEIQKAESNEEVILAFANYIRTLEKENRHMFYFKLASLMLIFIAGKNKNQLTNSNADLIIQLCYTHPESNKLL